MDIELEQLEIVKILLTVRNKATLDKVRDILFSSQENDRISVKQYNEELEAALERVKQGHFVTHEDVKAKSRKWRKTLD